MIPLRPGSPPSGKSYQLKTRATLSMRSSKPVRRKSSVSAKPTTATTSSARRPRGQKPAPIVEYPEPLFTDWIEPATFNVSLALHMRRHGDIHWGLWRALIRPGEVFDRTTLQFWTAGRRAPRSSKSFEMLLRCFGAVTSVASTICPAMAR